MKEAANSEAVSAPPAGTPTLCAPTRKNGWALWLGVSFAFSLLVLAYVFAFRAAHQAQIKDVPLATKGGRP